MRKLVLLLSLLTTAFAQTAPPDPSYPLLDQAYQALRAKDYNQAITQFRKAIALLPDRPSIRKDLAYTFLKVGENEAARDQFAEAMKLDPADVNVALEYGFLCYETRQQVQARRVFDRLRRNNATAAQAFENVDRPLREGIARWQTAVAAEPANFSGHEELAKLADQREDLALAAENYEKAWRLRPARRDLLVGLGRVYKQMERAEDSMAVLLAASRTEEPRVAEQARELLPERYPYVYEFEQALALDDGNLPLRRELAYLLLQINQTAKSEVQFQALIERAPDDMPATAQLGLMKLARGDPEAALPLLNNVLARGDPALVERVRAALHPPEKKTELKAREIAPPGNSFAENKELGLKSLEKGYLKDALKYLTIAHEADPADYEVMLKLGWTNNMLKDDKEAVKWFGQAAASPDPAISAEAEKAYKNLAPTLDRFRTTVWVFPTFSTRWHDLFAYAQTKTELRLPGWFIHPYLSVRFTGDTHGAVTPSVGFAPQYLSENAVTLGLGIATNAWHRASAWFEAGEQMRYRASASDSSRMTPDFRGGVTYTKELGHVMARGSRGLFGETNDDAVYVSRFDKDTLFYTQNRVGYTFRETEGWGGFHPQLYWNGNLTADVKRQYWANTFETGPGLRFRFERMPSLLFSVNAMRGTYVVNDGNPRGANFRDFRVGVWYAFTR